MVTMARHPKARLVEMALEASGKNPSWLAQQMGIAKQSVYKWLTDTMPRDDAVFDRMLAIIPAPPDDIAVVKRSEANQQLQMMQAGDLAVLPVWRAAAGSLVGDDEFAFEETDDAQAVPAWLLLPGLDVERHRIVAVSGYSMSPRIDSGALVILRLASEAGDGQIVCAQSGTGRLYLKTLRRGKRGPELHSINPRFSPIASESLDGWRIRGVAVAIQHAYEPGRANIEFDAGRPLRA